VGLSPFDQATAARMISPGRYEVIPDGRFAFAPRGPDGRSPMSGGVLVATVLRAVLAGSPHPHPIATSTNFLRVPRLGPAEVRVDWLRQGNTTAVARAALIQDDDLLLDATVTTATLTGTASATAPSWTAAPPAVPPAADCVELPSNRGFAGQVDVRLDPATAGWLDGTPPGVPEMRGYVQLRPYRDPDAYLLALAVDALPPVVFGLGALGWAPTVELTWHQRAEPAAGLLWVAARGRLVRDGWFDEETEVWDCAGTLVAQSRQLARVGRPRR
jgi:hypothetical protein